MKNEDRIRRGEQQSRTGSLWNFIGAQFDSRIPVPTSVKASTSFNTTSRQNRVTVTWVEEYDPMLDYYDIWVRLPSGDLIMAHTAKGSPAVWDMGSTESLGAAVAYVQPVTRNGLRLDLDRCPSAPFLLQI
jgi:hypothetical protein